MPTPKSLREAPDRIFENYILTLSIGSDIGLTKIPQEKLLQVPGSPGLSGQDDGTSEVLDIGFQFEFDGIIYRQFVVNTNGWVILVDPTTPSGTSGTTIASDVMSIDYRNTSINSSFSRNHSLFAVWFDDLRNTFSNHTDLALPQSQISLYEKGINQPNKRVNPRKYGVQYYNENNSNEGRRLILRWNCVSDYSIPNSILNFDFVMYENGKIEYRYDKRDSIGPTTVNEDATIGVFMHGGTWRFRDFSIELGYGSSRKKYPLGGAIYDPSYSDTADSFTVPYGVNLKPESYWPGQQHSGAVFTFQPPLNRRKVLPRLSLKEKDARPTIQAFLRTGGDQSFSNYSMFDDRKSIVYGTRNDINYPSLLPRFYANTLPGVEKNQDLFLEDIITTGSIVKASVDEYLTDTSKKYVSPFTENKLFENDPGTDEDSFFTVGSSAKEVGEGFSQPLKSKTQIRLSYRVDHKTTMFGTSSSIYYFNSKTGRWQYPTASFESGFDIGTPYEYISNYKMVEVDRGFNAFGFCISSGSFDGVKVGTDESFNQYLTKQSETEMLGKRYEKTLQINQEYNAINDETITIPITQPFLLEKAVVEIPIEAGPGWFYDKTQCILPGRTGHPTYPLNKGDGTTFDIGGPGLTFALYNQIYLGKEKRRRDLILSGTITHEKDNSAKIAYFQMLYGTDYYSYAGGTFPRSDVYQCTPRGFLAYGTPAGIVKGNNDFFTGSAKFHCEAAISNGVLVRNSTFMDQDASTYPDNRISASTKMFKSPVFRLNKSGDIQNFYSTTSPPTQEGDGCSETILTNVNNFGRGATGFEPSGRSVLGKEHVTTQGVKNPDEYDNPFYLYSDSIVSLSHGYTGEVSEGVPEDVDVIIQDFALSYPVVIMTHVIQKQSVKKSPYLLMPNDKLVLSISKSRPFFLSADAPDPYTMNEIQHDIKLTTGSINITLYGSLVANGKEHHDSLNQPLFSDAVHEVIIGGTSK